MKIFLKEFYHKKTTKYYSIIIFFLIFIITNSFLMRTYSKELINDNYDGSYILIYSINEDNLNELKSNSNVKSITNEDGKYKITLKYWQDSNDINEYLLKNNIDYTFKEKKKSDLQMENYYDYFLIIIILIIIISVIIYIFIVLNIIQDESKNNFMYHVLGYNRFKIYNINSFKLLFLIISNFILNEIIQVIIMYFLNIKSYINLYIFIVLILFTLLILLLELIKDKILN